MYEQLGDYKNALHFARQNKIHADTLYNDQKNSEISYHQLQMAEADKATLEQKKSDSRAKSQNQQLHAYRFECHFSPISGNYFIEQKMAE